MLRHPIPEAYKWIILWFILALLLLMAEATLLPHTIVALMSQIQKIASAFLLQIFQFIR